MPLQTWLQSIFKTRSIEAEAFAIKQELTRESLKTTVKLNQASRAIKKNMSITENIARAMGVI